MMEVTANHPMIAFVDGDRVRLEARLTDGSELFVWMTKDDFAASLQMLLTAAWHLGVEWPVSKMPLKSN
jgi:hypothetical protein